MLIRFPQIPGRIDVRFLSIVLDTIRDSVRQVNSRIHAQDRMLLRSPNGTVYAVTVDDSGNIQTVVPNDTFID